MLTDKQIIDSRNAITGLLLSTNRKGMESVIRYLEESGFYEVPSSLNRHHNWRGGLAQHCLGVYLAAHEHGEGLPEDSLIIAGLLHDICKARKLYYDENGKVHHRHTSIHGHGRRSVKILEQCGLELTEDERLAIRWHMGGHHARAEEAGEVKKARSRKLWQVIHRADRWDAARIVLDATAPSIQAFLAACKQIEKNKYIGNISRKIVW